MYKFGTLCARTLPFSDCLISFWAISLRYFLVSAADSWLAIVIDFLLRSPTRPDWLSSPRQTSTPIDINLECCYCSYEPPVATLSYAIEYGIDPLNDGVTFTQLVSCEPSITSKLDGNSNFDFVHVLIFDLHLNCFELFGIIYMYRFIEPILF